MFREKPEKQTIAAVAACARVLFQTTLVRNGEFPAALLAAASEEFAAIFRFHALTETMFVLACAAGRLIRAFHRLVK